MWSRNMNPNWMCVAAVATVVAFGGTARADEKPENLRVVVVAILANEENQHVDAKLERIAREVQKIEPQLTGFRLAKATWKKMSVGGKETFPLIDKEQVSIVVEHGADQDKRVGLRVKPTGVGEITYTTACGKCFPIVTGYRTKDNERLIIAVMVRHGTERRKSAAEDKK